MQLNLKFCRENNNLPSLFLIDKLYSKQYIARPKENEQKNEL